MKTVDMQKLELRSVKAQNARSSEIISQLKDAEGKSRELLSSVERQLAEAKEMVSKLETQNRTLAQKHKETAINAEGLNKQAEDLKALIASKDKENLSASKQRRELEEDMSKTKSRLEDTKKQLDTLRKSRSAANDADSDDWRVRINECVVSCEL